MLYLLSLIIYDWYKVTHKPCRLVLSFCILTELKNRFIVSNDVIVPWGISSVLFKCTFKYMKTSSVRNDACLVLQL